MEKECEKMWQFWFYISLVIIVNVMGNFVGINVNLMKYVYRSLLYKVLLQDLLLCQSFDDIFVLIIVKSVLYIELGLSQVCEYVNREICLRVLKYFYYGESESLDFRVKVIVVFINEGRKYLLEVK